MKLYIFILSIVFTISTQYIQAQCNYKGRIIDQANNEALVGASIIYQDKVVGITALQGDYSIEIPCDVEYVQVEYLGYKTQEFQIKGTSVLALQATSATMNQVVVSASRAEQKRSEVPLAISTIQSAVMEQTKATRLDELLNKVSGVYMVDLGNEQHTMAIRQPINYKGLFLYLEDGLPIRPTGVFNHNALLEMNMASLRTIEVIRGPASSMYGSEAIGGAINFITRKPTVVPTAKISLQGNTVGYRRADLHTSATFGKLGLGVSGYYAQRRKGFRKHSDFDKLALSFTGNYLIDQRNAISFSASYIDYYADMTGSLDSAFYFAKNYSSQHTFTNRRVDALRAKVAYDHYWEDGSTTKVALFARDNSIKQNPSYRVKDDYSSWKNPTGDKNLAHGEINDNSVQSFGFVAQHRQYFNLFSGGSVTLGLSTDNSPNSYQSKYISITKNNDKIYTAFTEHDSVLSDYKVDLLNIGAYLNTVLKLTPKLQLTAALRYDQLNFDFKNNLDAEAFSGAPDDIDNFSALTPKLGLNYQLTPKSGLFMNYSRGFLPPQIGELYRGVKIPVLKPAIYNNYELGAWLQLGDYMNMDLSVYQLLGKNEIVSVRLDNGQRVNQNAGSTEHYGVEYGLNSTIWEDIHLRFSGTNAIHSFLDYKDSGKDYSGKRMGQAPSWIANAELTYKPSLIPGFRIGAEWQHIDSYFMDNANSKSYPGHNIINIRAGYKYQGIEFWTNVMNVSNRLYATVARSSRWGDRYSVGEPRSINIGISFSPNLTPRKKY